MGLVLIFRPRFPEMVAMKMSTDQGFRQFLALWEFTTSHFRHQKLAIINKAYNPVKNPRIVHQSPIQMAQKIPLYPMKNDPVITPN